MAIDRVVGCKAYTTRVGEVPTLLSVRNSQTTFTIWGGNSGLQGVKDGVDG